MDERKLKHLEFIQNVITRMNTNSFFCKGWMVTLVSAIFALSAKDSDPRYLLVSVIAIIVFWVLDGFYLSQEKRYRGLYNSEIKKVETTFEMDASGFGGRFAWLSAMSSKTLRVLYPPMLVIVVGIAAVLFLKQRSTHPQTCSANSIVTTHAN